MEKRYPFPLRALYKSRAGIYSKILKSEVAKHKNTVYINPTEIDVDKNIYKSISAEDKFHPNDEGHRFWFDIIKPSL